MIFGARSCSVTASESSPSSIRSPGATSASTTSRATSAAQNIYEGLPDSDEDLDNKFARVPVNMSRSTGKIE